MNQLAREYLAEATAELPKDWVKAIAVATRKLSEAAALFFDAQSLVQEDVQIFLRVLEVYREKCLAEQYNPSDIVPTEVLLLGILIGTNFETHGESLNNAI